MNLNWGTAFSSMPYLLEGLLLTIKIAVLGLLFGFIIGLLFGLMRTSKNKLLYGIATFYVEIVRGTPILVQAVWLYFGLNAVLVQAFDWRISEEPAAIIVLAVNAGAYIAELVRGSIESVAKGQTEAGRSLGLTKFQTFIHIIWPQAFKRLLPPLGNQFIASLKDTSLFIIIGVGEVLRKGQEVVANQFNAFEMYTLVAALYLCLTLSISYALRFMERRLHIE